MLKNLGAYLGIHSGRLLALPTNITTVKSFKVKAFGQDKENKRVVFVSAKNINYFSRQSIKTFSISINWIFAALSNDYGEARAHRCYNFKVGSMPGLKHWARLKDPSVDKHSSPLWYVH